MLKVEIMYKVYGIPNCNTVKKALTYLEEQGVEFEFINFKKAPPTKSLITQWKKDLGDWPTNTKGPTYRKIRDDFEAGNAAQKYQLLIDNSSAIKRPIVTKKDKLITIGFNENEYKTNYSSIN